MPLKENKNKELVIHIPEDVLVSLKLGPQGLKEEMQQTIAIKFFQAKKLSLGKAAQLAGMNRLDFMDLLAAEGHVIFDYDEDDALNEIAIAESL